MSVRLVDSHCHLTFPSYAVDLNDVLARMHARKVAGITIGTSLANSETALTFAARHKNIWASAGLHPEHVTSSFIDEEEGAVHEQDIDVARLRTLAKHPKCVAIGETGLDYYRIDEGRDLEEAKGEQERVFLEHIRVAQELDLPVVIHCREALGRLAEIVQETHAAGKPMRGVVHSFTGTWEEAKPLLDLGLYIAVNGIATFPLRKTQRPEDAINLTIERIPLDRLLVETDAPFLAPAPHRGKRNEPTFVEHVAEHVARIRRLPLSEIEQATTENAARLFRLQFEA